MKKPAQGRLGIALVILQLLAYYGNRGGSFAFVPNSIDSNILVWFAGFLGYNLFGIIGAILVYRGFFAGPANVATATPDTPATPAQPPSDALESSKVDEEDIPWESNVEQTDDPGGEWEELKDWPKDSAPPSVPPKS